jgi:hypothetical protein
LRVGLHPEDRRPAFTCELERLPGRVDAGDDRSQLRELGSRLTRSALQVEDALFPEVGERVADLTREAALAGHGGRAALVKVVPRSPVVLGRFHQASSE